MDESTRASGDTQFLSSLALNMFDSLPSTTDDEQPIAPLWRSAIVSIVSALVRGDFDLSSADSVVIRPSAEDAETMSRSIRDYGAGPLIELPAETWITSVASFYGTYWSALVDLWTAEGPSDLVLHLEIRRTAAGYKFEVHGIYVP